MFLVFFVFILLLLFFSQFLSGCWKLPFLSFPFTVFVCIEDHLMKCFSCRDIYFSVLYAAKNCCLSFLRCWINISPSNQDNPKHFSMAITWQLHPCLSGRFLPLYYPIHSALCCFTTILEKHSFAIVRLFPLSKNLSPLGENQYSKLHGLLILTMFCCVAFP